MPHLEAALAAGIRTLGLGLVLMFTLSLAPYIPQLVGGAFLLRELARLWCLLNLAIMFEILRSIIVFAYFMLLTVRNLRLVVNILVSFGYVNLLFSV